MWQWIAGIVHFIVSSLDVASGIDSYASRFPFEACPDMRGGSMHTASFATMTATEHHLLCTPMLHLWATLSHCYRACVCVRERNCLEQAPAPKSCSSVTATEHHVLCTPMLHLIYIFMCIRKYIYIYIYIYIHIYIYIYIYSSASFATMTATEHHLLCTPILHLWATLSHCYICVYANIYTYIYIYI